MDVSSSAPVGAAGPLAANSSAHKKITAGAGPGSNLHAHGNPWFLALTALGVVYGDIGTSPLYAFQVALTGIGHPVPTAADVLGIVSLIFWALMVMVSLKYVTFVLRADNEGEGGILALLSLVGAGQVANGARLPLLVLLGVVGAALLYGDGVITPAISVLSAMEGLKLIAPAFQTFVVPATMAILIGLFVIQRRGTESIGRLFGPVMVVWFVVIGVLGAANIWAAPAIIKAINPAAAVGFLAANPVIAFAVIGAVFLALTGGEALYADMGHVGPTAIRRAWFGLVLPALILNYFGQGALILTDPAAADSPFYRLAPGWALIPMVALAALATIIASQVTHLRRLFADAAGHVDGIVPTGADRGDIERRRRADLCACRQLAADGGHAVDRSRCSRRPTIWRPPTASPCPEPCWSPRFCSIGSRLRAGAGRPPSQFRSLPPSAPSTPHSLRPTRSRSCRAAGFR